MGVSVRLEWSLEDVWNEWFAWVGVVVGSVVAVVVDYLRVDLCLGAGVVSSDDVKKRFVWLARNLFSGGSYSSWSSLEPSGPT
jgi:hypothetical protein